MIPATEDTIVAQASVPGPAVRAIVRMSGPKSGAILATLFVSTHVDARFQSGFLKLPSFHSSLPAIVLWQAGPNTYTGQDLAEIHLIGCQPMVDTLIGELLNAGARTAQPGEFTLRGFLAGKRDLPQSEAVLAVIEAQDKVELKQALTQLAGGVTQPLSELREDLLNLVADVEAGLDFADEKIEFIDKTDLLLRLGKGLAQLMNLRRQLDDRAVVGKQFRVALVGLPNAGKSSLFNALVGGSAAIVSATAGTTRDYVTRSVRLGQHNIELIDTAGWQLSTDTIEAQSQQLGRQQMGRSELVIECIEASGTADESIAADANRLRIATKCDIREGNPAFVQTSSRTNLGLGTLRKLIEERATAFFHPALAPSLSRCRHHVDRCIGHLRSAHSYVLTEDAPEIVAAETRMALDELGEMTGAIYTEDLLGRIFSRFCVGK